MRSHASRLTALLAVAMATLVTACDDDAEPLAVGCIDIASPAVVVTLLDATTGEADATEARGVVVEGAYADSLRTGRVLRSGRAVSLAAAYERPGTYAVRVERPGYHPVARAGVVAPRGPCGVMTAEVVLWMHPAS